jgi:large subunit ribosomal protein L5
MTMTPRMKEIYTNQVLPKVAQEFDIKNVMARPKLEKIVLSVGMGKELDGTKLKPAVRTQVIDDLTVITGQKPVMRVARKAVSNFKVREGYEIGAMVTLRGARMWEFLDRLITLAIPRIKDFRGLKDTSFDGRGNYSFGVTEQGIFPEVDMTNVQFNHGMHITLVFKNSTDAMTRALMVELGVPFVKPEDKKKN